jgi:hypothetical protein
MNNKRTNYFIKAGLFCWASIGIQALLPIPFIFVETVPEKSIVDLVWWIFFGVITIMGIWSSIRLKKSVTLKPALVFVIAVMFYLWHRLFFGRYIYMGFWSDILAGTPFKTSQMVWNVMPWEPINVLLFYVLIPAILIVVSTWLLKQVIHNKKFADSNKQQIKP